MLGIPQVHGLQYRRQRVSLGRHHYQVQVVVHQAVGQHFEPAR